jgi:hypothetical protein
MLSLVNLLAFIGCNVVLSDLCHIVVLFYMFIPNLRYGNATFDNSKSECLRIVFGRKLSPF